MVKLSWKLVRPVLKMAPQSPWREMLTRSGRRSQQREGSSAQDDGRVAAGPNLCSLPLELKAEIATALTLNDALALRAVSSAWTIRGLFRWHPACCTIVVDRNSYTAGTLKRARILGEGCRKLVCIEKRAQFGEPMPREHDDVLALTSCTSNVIELDVGSVPLACVVMWCQRLPLLVSLIAEALFQGFRRGYAAESIDSRRAAAAKISQTCTRLETVRSCRDVCPDGPGDFGAPYEVSMHYDIFSVFPNLTSLWVPQTDALDFLAACPRINQLYNLQTANYAHWLGCPPENILSIVRACTAQLIVLDLTACRFQSASDAVAIISSCPHLSELFLWDVARSTAGELVEHDPDVHPWLLCAAFSSSEWEGLAAAMPASLTSLCIGGDTLCDDAVVALCASGTHMTLARLVMAQSAELTNEALEVLAASRFAASLVYLDISCMHAGFEYETIAALVDACTELRELTYFQPDDDEDDEWSEYLHILWDDNGLGERLTELMESRGGRFKGELFY